MSPQLLWTIAGLVLTVLTLGGVTISSISSMDSATAKLVASEAGNIGTASKLWLANTSTTGNFNGITATVVNPFIPDLAVASGNFASKAATGVTFAVASTTPFSEVVITIANIPAGIESALTAALTGKSCAASAIAAGSMTYTCKG